MKQKISYEEKFDLELAKLIKKYIHKIGRDFIIYDLEALKFYIFNEDLIKAKNEHYLENKHSRMVKR